MSGYDHKIETSLEGIENLSKEKNEEIERNDAGPKIHSYSSQKEKAEMQKIKISAVG